MTRLLTESSTAATGTEPFLFDPASGATTLVSDIVPGGTGSQAFFGGSNGFAALPGGRTVFAAVDANGTQEPWITDGTAAGTHVIAAIDTGVSSAVPVLRLGTRGYTFNFSGTVHGLVAQAFVALNARQVLFTAGATTADVARLWVTDGTAAGTVQLGAFSNPQNVTALGDGRALFPPSTRCTGTGCGSRMAPPLERLWSRAWRRPSRTAARGSRRPGASSPLRRAIGRRPADALPAAWGGGGA